MKKSIRSKILGEKLTPYFSLRNIVKRFELLELYDPDNIEVGYVKNSMQGNSIYRTLSGQGILYVKISETDEKDRDREMKKRKLERPIIVLVAGIGGRDWMAVHAIIHVITYLVTSYSRKKLAGFDWWIIPVLNPDGYINSIDNKMSRDYMLNINPTDGCPGVNLDRNFLFQRTLCRDGRRKFNCQENPGKHPFSEIESNALRNFISSRSNNCKVFVAIKEGVKALVYPFASSFSPSFGPHSTVQDLLCTEALEVFDQFHGGIKGLFRFGNSGRIFGLSNGYVEDWARRHVGIPRSFAFYIANRGEQELETAEMLEEYGKATLKAILVLATSRRDDPYPETFQELINQTSLHRLSRFQKSETLSRPIPWGKELVNRNLRDKINRGAKLDMPIEFMKNEEDNTEIFL